MKITNLTTTTLCFNDLGKQIKGVAPIDRAIRLGANESMYLLETSDILLSAQSGDIKKFKDAGKLSVNDSFVDVPTTESVTIEHNFGIIPNVTVVLDSGVVAVVGTDVTIEHDTDFTTTTITNASAGDLSFSVRIG
jgi:hypothetical protein